MTGFKCADLRKVAGLSILLTDQIITVTIAPVQYNCRLDDNKKSTSTC